VTSLRDRKRGDLLVWGSINLSTDLLAHGLVDQLNLMIDKSSWVADSAPSPSTVTCAHGASDMHHLEHQCDPGPVPPDALGARVRIGFRLGRESCANVKTVVV
jgi:hypothetical protein